MARTPVAARGRALATLVGGLTVANVVGVPAGTALGQALGWRSAFWAVTVFALVAVAGVAVSVREDPRAGRPRPSVARELHAFRRPRLWVALSTTALFQAGIMGAITYVGPLLLDVTLVPEAWVPLVFSIAQRYLPQARGYCIGSQGLAFNVLQDNVFLDSTRGFLEWLNEQYYNGATICSICTGAFLLAESGLLNGKDCITHWKYLKQFQEQYKMVNMVSNRLFVESDNIFTSAGVASGIDLALYILEKRYGSLFASKIAREIVIYFRRAGNDPQLSICFNSGITSRIAFIQFRSG